MPEAGNGTVDGSGSVAPIHEFRPSGDAVAEQHFAFVRSLETGLISVVGLEGAEIPDGGSQCSATSLVNGERHRR